MAETKYKKPYYGIKLDLAQVGVDIRLNDIPIYFDEEKGQLSIDLPAPNSIINGKNELKIIAFTPYIDDENKMEHFLPGSEVKASLYVQEYDDPKNKKEILTSISLTFNDKHKVEITNISDSNLKDAEIKESTSTKAIVTRCVKVDSGFPQWQWQKGKLIDNTDDNFTSLLKSYKNIYDAFKNKNTKQIFDIYEQKAKEISIAYHLKNTQEGHNKISTGIDMMDDELELYEFWTEGMVLDIYANGRLARIINEDTTQPIIFIDRSAGSIHTHKLGFYKNTNNEWILIR